MKGSGLTESSHLHTADAVEGPSLINFSSSKDITSCSNDNF